MNTNRKESLWIHCPICRGKTRTKVYEDTVLVKFPLYCPKCKKEIRIDVIKAHYKSYQRVLVRVDLVKLKSGKSQFDS